MSGSRFQFNAPQAAALDPSQLEAIYAQQAGKQLGPGMNLGLNMVEAMQERQRQQQYLEALAQTNKQAMEAGKLNLAHDADIERLKAGIDLLKTTGGGQWLGTPLGLGAVVRGANDVTGTDPRVLQEIYSRGGRTGEANIFETVGKGTQSSAAAGYMPDFAAIGNLTGIPVTPGTPTGVASASAGRPLVPRFTRTVDSTGKVTLTENIPDNMSLDDIKRALQNREQVVTGQQAPSNPTAPVTAAKIPTQVAGSLNAYLAANPGAKFLSMTQDAQGRQIAVVSHPKLGTRKILLQPMSP